jgi:hypothetical protein
MRSRSRSVLVAANLALLLAVSFAGCGRSAFRPPPDSAGPEVVLRVYLDELQAGDCAATQTLAISTFRPGNGELCGITNVSAYEIGGEPATVPGATEVVFAASLTTTGTDDGSLRAGSITWFYSLKRQASGAWRLAGGGTGP